MKWMEYYVEFFENIIYFVLMASVLTCLNKTSEEWIICGCEM